MNRTRRVAVIGGGISGLTAAYRLQCLLPKAEIQVFEASDRLGGVLQTRHSDDFLIELGADSFIDKLPAAVELCRELGLAEEIIPTNEYPRRALILSGGKLHPVPKGFVQMRAEAYLPMLRSSLLSWRGKLRMLCERWIARKSQVDQEAYDESVASFATRRHGREVFERLVQPLLAGIYTADAEQLSTAATMQTAIQGERDHGSLRAAALHDRAKASNVTGASGARYASFVTLQGGLGRLISTLAAHLPSDAIRLRTPVETLAKTAGDRWSLTVGTKANDATIEDFDAVVVALPAPRAAKLLAASAKLLSTALAKIPYASSAVAALAYRRDQIADSLDGFGMVVPAVERRKIVAASYSSVKFPGRAPEDHVLLRVFVGGALQPDLLDLADDELVGLAHAEVAEVLGISGEPQHTELVRWTDKMPQYHVGHLHLVEQIEAAVRGIPNLALAGNAYRGVGIPQCVQSGETAAQSIVDQLRQIADPGAS